MKILVLSTNGIFQDGITAWLVRSFASIDPTGLTVDTVAWEGVDAGVVSRVESVGVRVHILPPRRQDVRAYHRSLIDLIIRERYDIVHVCGNSATTVIELSAAKKGGVPVRMLHSHNTSCEHPLFDALLRPWMHALANSNLACGIEAGTWLFGRRPFTVIRNGMDFEDYRFDRAARVSARAELGLGEGDFAIGHVGHFIRQKNHPFLLEMIAELHGRMPEARLFMLGDGPLREALEDKAHALGIDGVVRFLGVRDDVATVLQAMDCMVLPSLFEGFPIVSLEWQAAGLPSLLSDAVTSECRLTPFVSALPLSAGASVWADALQRVAAWDQDRDAQSKEAINILTDAGYDAQESARRLRETYVAEYQRLTYD